MREVLHVGPIVNTDYCWEPLPDSIITVINTDFRFIQIEANTESSLQVKDSNFGNTTPWQCQYETKSHIECYEKC